VITQSNIYFAKFVEDSTGKSVMNQNDRLETILIETIEAQFDVQCVSGTRLYAIDKSNFSTNKYTVIAISNFDL